MAHLSLNRYTDCIIIGDLDISDWRKDLEEIEVTGIPRKVVESPIEIRYSTIHGNVNFNPTYFNNTVVFDNVIFEDSVSFFYAVFDKTTVFQDSTFKDKADFGEATFNEGAHFSRVKFNDARFRNATFNNYTSFDFATFDGRTTFCNAIFVKEADFYGCTFSEFTYFFNATFNNLARFQWATFNGAVSFRGATFNGTANFCRASFNGEVHAQSANFNDIAYFVLAKFKDRVYFTDASFKDNVDFSDADIFLTMKIRWSQLDGRLTYNDYFYQSLIRNFETLGQSEDANDAYYEYRVVKRKHLKSPLDSIRRLLEFIFLDIFCGYGVKPLRAIRWAIIFIGLFSVFYWLIGDKRNNESKSDSSLKGRWERFWEFVFLSVSIFTTLGYWNKWKPAKNHETKFRIGVITEGFLGWLIMVLFIISLTMTWIR